ncbi:hypothetical protein K7I13_11150 [Brucepastera parasyntrophica]|uniref:pullulanase-associated domain-containing protein n=1 Tax=Brucepastera parasyntrophica TaxID=2880008 RepID=UPI00210CFAB9|nr:pullulanase-associated domain-containing protein [Brucepastera parasyntrophica]ULQ59062.1 hypothetical protein K7I13_11150 [Brucepastera parasyntrophica]
MKKQYGNIFTIFLFVLMAFFISCGTGSSGGGGDDSTGRTIRIHLMDEASGAWNIWLWKDVAEPSANWPSGATKQAGTDAYGVYYKVKLKDNAAEIGFLFLNSGGTQQTSDLIISGSLLTDNDDFYVSYGDSTIYLDPEAAKGLSSLSVPSATVISGKIVGYSNIDASDLVVKNSEGDTITVSSVSVTKPTIQITLDATNTGITKTPYAVTFNNKTVDALPTADFIDSSSYVYTGTDLGYDPSTGSVKVWAPLATKVSLLVYTTWQNAKTDVDAIKNSSYILDESVPIAGSRTAMTKDTSTGAWSGTIVPTSGYYLFEITNAGRTYRVCDIYAKSAAPNSVASQIIDIDSAAAKPTGWSSTYTNPFGNSGMETKSYSEAVIFEMHIRDWSRAFVPTSLGKFDDITAALQPAGEFAAHLADLGVTHVQILPMFDYAEKNEDDEDPDTKAYNWGYNPYQFNVPEGRYVKNHNNGGQEAVLQLRQMVKAFHDAGIAVIMDVVYNHTAGQNENSLYDMTVPQYYYRMNSSGGYSNGSGTGNETASNTIMFKKYMMESLTHWMETYHINGFRFDLMGLHETGTMKDIYNELKLIDPNVMVYGEPWTGGTSPVISGVTKARIDNCSNNLVENGVACFNDDFRNAIKGAEFGGFQKGHVQGIFKDTAIITGLKGSLSADGGFTDKIGRSLNYVECHDNYTLADKLAISLNNGTDYKGWKWYSEFTPVQQDELRAQNKLSAAYVFLAQGTPLLTAARNSCAPSRVTRTVINQMTRSTRLILMASWMIIRMYTMFTRV